MQFEIVWFINQGLFFFKNMMLMFLFTPYLFNRCRDKQPNCFCLLIPEGIGGCACVRRNLRKDVLSLHVLLGLAIKMDEEKDEGRTRGNNC